MDTHSGDNVSIPFVNFSFRKLRTKIKLSKYRLVNILVAFSDRQCCNITLSKIPSYRVHALQLKKEQYKVY